MEWISQKNLKCKYSVKIHSISHYSSQYRSMAKDVTQLLHIAANYFWNRWQWKWWLVPCCRIYWKVGAGPFNFMYKWINKNHGCSSATVLCIVTKIVSKFTSRWCYISQINKIVNNFWNDQHQTRILVSHPYLWNIFFKQEVSLFRILRKHIFILLLQILSHNQEFGNEHLGDWPKHNLFFSFWHHGWFIHKAPTNVWSGYNEEVSSYL